MAEFAEVQLQQMPAHAAPALATAKHAPQDKPVSEVHTAEHPAAAALEDNQIATSLAKD